MRGQSITLDEDRADLLDWSGEMADWLLDSAVYWAMEECGLDEVKKVTAGQAVLMACHVITTLHFFRHEENRAQPNQPSGEDGEQAVKDYDYLKWLVEKATSNLSEAEESEARKRIIEISGV